MTEFETEAIVGVVVDQGSLRDARDEIESGLAGAANVSVDQGGRATVADGGALAGAGGDAIAGELTDQTDILEDILDEIETGGVGGGPGSDGGGIPFIGGGGDGGDGGIFDTIVDAAIFKKLSERGGSGGGGGILRRLFAGVTLPFIGGSIATATGQADNPLLGAIGQSPLFQLFGAGVSGAQGLENLINPPSSPKERSQALQLAVEADILSEERAQQIRQQLDLPKLDVSQETTQAADQWQDIVNSFDGLEIDRPQWVDDVLSIFGVDTGDGFATDPSGEGVTDTSDIRDDPSLTTPGFGPAAVESFDFFQPIPRTEEGNRVGTSDLRGGPSLDGNRAQQRQPQRNQVNVRNDITAQLDISNLRDLQRFLRNPERFINNAITTRGGPR